jgi:hypothetical protein
MPNKVCITTPGPLQKAESHVFENASEDSLWFKGGMVLASLFRATRGIYKTGLGNNISLAMETLYDDNNSGYLMLERFTHSSKTIIYMDWITGNVETQFGDLRMALAEVIPADSRQTVFAIDLVTFFKTMPNVERSVMAIFHYGVENRKVRVSEFADIYGALYLTRIRQFLLSSNADTWYFAKGEGYMAKRALLIDEKSNLVKDSNCELTNGTSQNLIPAGIPNDMIDLWEKMPEKEKAILIGMDPELRISFIRNYRVRLVRQEDEAKNQGEEIRQAIMPGGQPQPEQMRFSFSPFPTQLTRTSPFFPISTQEIAKREYIRDMVIASHSWGELTYTGPKLSVFEEDHLMILLALICDVNARIEEACEGGEITYTYTGNIRKILKLKRIENPGANHYKTVIDSLTLLTGASFKLITKKTGKGKKDLDTTYVNNILTNFSYKHGSGNLKVTVNPYFYQTFGQGMVTWLDVQIRSRLKSAHAKALYRFIMSHRDDKWDGPLLTLAASTNMDPNLPKIKTRERLKKAIGELVEVGVLTERSKINGDFVELWRTPKKSGQRMNRLT